MNDGIRVETTRGQIRTVAERWRAQYPNPEPKWAEVQRRLDALDPETATAGEVDEIIGNDSWTREICDCCGEDITGAWVRLGEEPDYESATVWVCAPCLNAAAAALASAQDSATAEAT